MNLRPLSAIATVVAANSFFALTPSTAQAPPTIDDGPDVHVSSSGQTGGVTAGRIDTLNATTVVRPETNAKRQRLVDAMLSYNRAVSDILKAQSANPTYVFFIEPDDPLIASPDGRAIVWFFIAEPEDYIDKSQLDSSCLVESGVVIRGGYVHVAKKGGGGQIKISPPVSRNHPLLQKICLGLRKPLDSIAGGTRTVVDSAGRENTIYDYLTSHSEGAITIRLQPGETDGVRLDTSIARHYIIAALAPMYGVNTNLAVDVSSPDTLSRLKQLYAGQSVTAELRPPSDLFSSLSNSEPVPVAMVNDFGAELENIRNDWLNYLSASTIDLRGSKKKVVSANEFSPVMHYFRSNELGSREFWRSAGDALSVARQINCLGARFLVDRGYARQVDVPEYAGCAAQMTAVFSFE